MLSRSLRPYLYASVLPLILHISAEPVQSREQLYGPETCIDCHKDSQREVEASVHGLGFILKQKRAPAAAEKISCMTCHNSHGRDNPETANFPVTRWNDLATCGQCHARERWVFFDHFHGKHFALGKQNIPNCTYCHIGHELPRDDPRSAINPVNVGRICAGCHGGTEDLGKMLMAANLATPSTSRVLYRKEIFGFGLLALPIKLFYSLLTGLALVLAFALGKETLARSAKVEEPSAGTQIVTRTMKVHLALFLALYLVLDSSGISLLYAVSHGDLVSEFMVKATRSSMKLFQTDDARSLAHRLAGLLLVLLYLFHLVYLARKREVLNRLRLEKTDLEAALAQLGLRRGWVPARRADWKVKATYWSMLLLVTVMVLTGFGQWAAFELMKYGPYRIVEYNNLIHDWNGRALSIFTYGVVVAFFMIFKPLSRWMGRARNLRA